MKDEHQYKILKRLKPMEAMMLIGIEDRRTFNDWCKKHGVSIIKDIGGSFVSEAEFAAKANKPIEDVLVPKYGENWQNDLSKHMGELKEKAPVTRIDNNEVPLFKSRYRPISASAKLLLGDNRANGSRNHKK